MGYPQAQPQVGPQQIIVPDLGAYKQQAMSQANPQPVEAKLLDVEVRWAGIAHGPDATTTFVNVAVGRDPGLGMVVLEEQGADGMATLIPPSAVQWMRVSPTLAGSVARAEAEEEDWSAAE
jgi:hypothetical protein